MPTHRYRPGKGSRAALAALLATALLAGYPGCSAPSSDTSTTASADPEMAALVHRIATEKMAEYHLNAVIVRVTVDGKEVITEALGESSPGVPATTDMHFRNGAVAISYVATALLQLVDEKKVSLGDRLSTWLPDVPHSDRVTLGQLAQMTSGYADYVWDRSFLDALLHDPFRSWSPEELCAYGTSKPLVYEPGTNWNYSHTNYVLLGLALEKITSMPMRELLALKVLGPLGLKDTVDPGTPEIQEPALRAYTAERREHLGIPAGTPFVEESTHWSPSWTITHGAIQTTNITDMTRTAEAVGTGELLSRESHAAQIAPSLRGRTSAVEGCPSCFPQSDVYAYGLGVVLNGDWLLQNPLFAGYSAVEAYLPSKRIAIAVAATYKAEAFDATGDVPNRADHLFKALATAIAPDHAPPTRQP